MEPLAQQYTMVQVAACTPHASGKPYSSITANGWSVIDRAVGRVWFGMLPRAGKNRMPRAWGMEEMGQRA